MMPSRSNKTMPLSRRHLINGIALIFYFDLVIGLIHIRMFRPNSAKGMLVTGVFYIS
jgi:hypothetical protein